LILERIAQSTKERVEQQKKQIPFYEMRRKAEEMNGDTGFLFERALQSPQISFICEIKRASPSKGMIAKEFPYLTIAKEYEQASASAISVLTEPQYFLGKDEYLKQIQQAVSIPLLRKDFTIDAYQIYQAKLLGASAVLLICALLHTEVISEYLAICDSLGLSALVETHDAKEVESALKAGARIVGVNNRNLHDFTVDIQNSVTLRKYVPKEKLFVAESGIQTANDIALLQQSNVDAVLIGETLMKSPDKAKMIRRLLGEEVD
jgi:indole-3-glycerol phosphate synthase